MTKCTNQRFENNMMLHISNSKSFVDFGRSQKALNITRERLKTSLEKCQTLYLSFRALLIVSHGQGANRVLK